MTEKDLARITPGDTVCVDFTTSPSIRGVIDYQPVATGDSWIIISGETKKAIYFQMFEKMTLLEKG